MSVLKTAFWNNKLTFNAAYFYRKTTDILYKPSASYSSIFGLGHSQVNTEALRTKDGSLRSVIRTRLVSLVIM